MRLRVLDFGSVSALRSQAIFHGLAFNMAADDDPVGNPFACEEISQDEQDVQTVGLELSTSWELGDEARWEPFAALSYNHMDLEFQVNARYSGLIDRTLLVTDGQTLYALAGIGYRISDRWRLAAEVFYSPLDVVRPSSTSTQTDELVNLRTGHTSIGGGSWV